MHGLVDQGFVGLDRMMHAERFDPGVCESLACSQRVQNEKKRTGERPAGYFRGEPDSRSSIEQIDYPRGRGQGCDGKARGRSLEQGAGQTLAPGREDKESRTGEVILGTRNIAGKVNGGFEVERTAQLSQRGEGRAFSNDGEVGRTELRRTEANAPSRRSNPFSCESLPMASRWGPGPDQRHVEAKFRVASRSMGLGRTSIRALRMPDCSARSAAIARV